MSLCTSLEHDQLTCFDLFAWKIAARGFRRNTLIKLVAQVLALKTAASSLLQPDTSKGRMTEAEAVIRDHSGCIVTSAKKDLGPLDFTGRIGGGLWADLKPPCPVLCERLDRRLPSREHTEVCVHHPLSLHCRLGTSHYLWQPFLGWHQWPIRSAGDDHVHGHQWSSVQHLFRSAAVNIGCHWPLPRLHLGRL